MKSAEGEAGDPHPLSPLSPTLARRSSATSLPAAGPSRTPASYFELPKDDPPRRHHATSLSSRHSRRVSGITEADLLGVGPSQRPFRPPGQTSNKPSPPISQLALMETANETNVSAKLRPIPRRGASSGSRPWSVYVESLRREEIGVVETRFDLMTDEELDAYLGQYGQALSTPSLATPRKPPDKTVSTSPTTPRAPRGAQSVRSKGADVDDEDKSPLFPPSPPRHAAKSQVLDHPLRILSRAIRELQVAVQRLEEENDRLRAPGATSSSPVIAQKAADRISIHENLTEALSTSLTSDSPIRDVSNPLSMPSDSASPRSRSPAPSTSRSVRLRSPASSNSIPFPSSSQDHNTSRHREAHSFEAPPTPKSQNHRPSWTSGLWMWNSGKKARPRRRSAGSTASHSQVTLGTSGQVQTVPESVLMDDEDEEGWRKGDGGSPPSFRAIFLATRIITPDPSSILVSSTIPANSLIANLSHSLICNARDEDIVARESPKRRRSREQSRSRAASIASADLSGSNKDGKGYGDQAMAVGRSLISSVSNATLRGSKPTNGTDGASRPSLLSRISSSRAFPTTAVSPPTAKRQSGSGPGFPTEEAPLPSLELASIVPDESRPPTVLLSRQNLGSFFQSTRVGKSKLQTASRFNSDEPPLTDRYGFIYDIQHAGMLKDASIAGTPAPASLSGGVPLGDEGGWIKRRSQSINGSTSPKTFLETSDQLSSARRSIDSAISATSSRSTVPRSRTPDGTSLSARHRSSTLKLNPSTARPVTAKDNLTVSSRGASSLKATATSDSSPIETDSLASRLTVSSLLDQLTEIHDRQQKERMVEWDAFLRKRQNTRKGQGMGLIGISQMGLDGKAGQEEFKAFSRLVRGGIPLSYRSDVWAECSGAKDSLVPGEYAEILAVHADDRSPVLAEIEKDVSRTFPGNVFFGGDGPGVAKLRRVLIAYSWHNPAVGYCQGMNMLAATLLLTHTDEEQAYWTLLCMIERLLPTSFFSPDLLASRVDQLVLGDLVAQLVPKVHQHLDDLGVDLASVTFGWFLSLFTDCLPVETLFRVWDVFFIEGHNTLFRVAISILKLNESDILACESVSDLFAFVSGMTSRLWGADKLITTQHSYKPIVRHSDVLSRYEKHLIVWQRELDEAEER